MRPIRETPPGRLGRDVGAADVASRRLPGREGAPDATDGRLVDVLSKLFDAVDEIRTLLAGRRKSHYTVEEVAEATGRAPYTVRHWISSRRIKAIRVPHTGPRGRLLVPREELERIIGMGLGGEVPGTIVG
jgi:excisionase family DNA binding protein